MDRRLHSMFRPLQINGMTAGSRYSECLPSASLLPHVACYWESGTDEELALHEDAAAPGLSELAVTARVLPDGCSDILITYDPIREGLDLSYCGNYTRPLAFYEEPVPSRPVGKAQSGYLFGVRFFPGGARVFHGIAMDELTDRRVPLDQIWPWTEGERQELSERILLTTSFAERAGLLDAYLRRKLGGRLPLPGLPEADLLKNVLHRIFTGGGQVSVRELAVLETTSERQLLRRFKPWIGINPKRFSEVYRCHRVLASIQQGSARDWTGLALSHGYFDQAHLIRHFNSWYGATPGVAAAEHRRKLSVMYNTRSTASDRI